jgi:hypothetical protein
VNISIAMLTCLQARLDAARVQSCSHCARITPYSEGTMRTSNRLLGHVIAAN